MDSILVGHGRLVRRVAVLQVRGRGERHRVGAGMDIEMSLFVSSFLGEQWQQLSQNDLKHMFSPSNSHLYDKNIL